MAAPIVAVAPFTVADITAMIADRASVAGIIAGHDVPVGRFPPALIALIQGNHAIATGIIAMPAVNQAFAPAHVLVRPTITIGENGKTINATNGQLPAVLAIPAGGAPVPPINWNITLSITSDDHTVSTTAFTPACATITLSAAGAKVRLGVNGQVFTMHGQTQIRISSAGEIQFA
jgi:hypothetical protein